MKPTFVIVFPIVLWLSLPAPAQGQLCGEALPIKPPSDWTLTTREAATAALPTDQPPPARESFARIAAATSAGVVMGDGPRFGMVAVTGGEPADGSLLPAANLLVGAIAGAVPSEVSTMATTVVARRARQGWLLPAIGAAMGATAFTYFYIEGCRRADCVGFAVPYTLGFGATAGAALGFGAELLLRLMPRERVEKRSPRPLNPES